MRPKIISHMICSIDGRLIPGRWSKPDPKGEQDLILPIYDEAAQRLGGDGWIVGRRTMEPMVKRCEGAAESQASTLPEPHRAERSAGALAIAIDLQGKLKPEEGHVLGDHYVSVLAGKVNSKVLSELDAAGASYVFAGMDGADLNAAMESIGSIFGVQTLLLEGGGVTNGQFLKAGLIDEISLLVYPGIDGLAGTPSIFEFVGQSDEKPADGKFLRFLSSEVMRGGVCWMRYSVHSLQEA